MTKIFTVGLPGKWYLRVVLEWGYLGCFQVHPSDEEEVCVCLSAD